MTHLILWLKLRALQFHLSGIESVIDVTAHPGIKNKYLERRMDVKRQLHRAEGAYKASLRERNKWGWV